MRKPTREGNVQDPTDDIIVNECMPFIGEYGVSSIALMRALESKFNSSEIYRALMNDKRVFGKLTDDGGMTLFRRVSKT